MNDFQIIKNALEKTKQPVTLMMNEPWSCDQPTDFRYTVIIGMNAKDKLVCKCLDAVGDLDLETTKRVEVCGDSCGPGLVKEVRINGGARNNGW